LFTLRNPVRARIILLSQSFHELEFFLLTSWLERLLDLNIALVVSSSELLFLNVFPELVSELR
jgi:hypothetical protein